MNPLQAVGIGIGVAALGVASFGMGIVVDGKMTPTAVAAEPVAVVSTVTSDPGEPSAPAVQVPDTLWTPDTVKGFRDFVPNEKAVVTRVTPWGDGPFGVGITISVTFQDPVSPGLRKQLERYASVTTSNPIGPAGWDWVTDTTMVYRPFALWPAHTKVEFRTKWIAKGLTDYNPGRTFQIGRQLELTVSYDTQMGTLVQDGKKLRDVPVSMGRPGLETWSGVMTVMEKYEMKRMINPQYHYDVEVPYAMRLTWDGIFLHAAPWNEYNLGVQPTSHGCINVSYDEGKWWFENSIIGDPVVVHGPSVDVPLTFGDGGAWNIPWYEWQRGAAYHP